MRKTPLPACSVCRTAKHVVAQGSVEITYVCTRCGGLFDDTPNEGGDVFSDPSKRMERAEARRERRRR